MVSNEAIGELVQALQPEPTDQDTTYEAVVSRVDEEGVVWVRLAGSDKETPTASTSAEVKRDDLVNVEWRNNKLYIAGNYSNPSAGAIRVDAVERAATVARTAAQNAVADAQIAREAAESVEGIAIRAEEYATEAKASAENASEYAARALGNLSTVQSVTETLNWITAHGTMALTSDTALDPTHVYFVVDQNGDYEVGGTHYSVVTEPDVADISTYYELSIDESLNNYVGTHLAVTSEGLWLLPDAGGNKVLIATGQGTTYTETGTYIIDDSDKVMAQFTTEQARIGSLDSSYLELTEDSMMARNPFGVEFLNIGLSTTKPTKIVYKKRFEGVHDYEETPPWGTPAKDNYTFNFRSTEYANAYDAVPSGGSIGVRFHCYVHYTMEGSSSTYSMQYNASYALTKGTYYSGDIGMFTLFYDPTYKALRGTVDRNKIKNSLGAKRVWLAVSEFQITLNAEAPAPTYEFGINVEASKPLGFCMGDGTIASETGLALGKYNVNDTNDDYALIIGNGTGSSARSNALSVTWDGNAHIDLADYQTADTTDKAIYDALVALGWESEVTE